MIQNYFRQPVWSDQFARQIDHFHLDFLRKRTLAWNCPAGIRTQGHFLEARCFSYQWKYFSGASHRFKIPGFPPAISKEAIRQQRLTANDGVSTFFGPQLDTRWPIR